MKLSLLLAVILITGCETVKFVPVPLPLPPPIERPTESDLACLSDTAYKKIVVMDKRITTLENIIKSTH